MPQAWRHSNDPGNPQMTTPLIPARHKDVNRAKVCDDNFVEFVLGWDGSPEPKPAPHEPVLDGSACTAADFLELFESQLVSRHLDLMARVLRVQQKVFYTIGSSGHEGNAMVARLARHTDPAFLHYRSGGFMAERFRKLPDMDPVMDSAPPGAPGRHHVDDALGEALPAAVGVAVGLVRPDRQARVEQEHPALGPGCEEAAVAGRRREGRVVVAEPHVHVAQRGRARRRRPDREGEAVRLVDVVVGVLPEDHHLDGVEGRVAGPAFFGRGVRRSAPSGTL
jgi:hypothetical protein